MKKEKVDQMGSWEDDSSYECGQVSHGRLLSREGIQWREMSDGGERERESMYVGCYKIIMYYQHACMHG